jgi:hypothetical protein
VMVRLQIKLFCAKRKAEGLDSQNVVDRRAGGGTTGKPGLVGVVAGTCRVAGWNTRG